MFDSNSRVVLNAQEAKNHLCSIRSHLEEINAVLDQRTEFCNKLDVEHGISNLREKYGDLRSRLYRSWTSTPETNRRFRFQNISDSYVLLDFKSSFSKFEDSFSTFEISGVESISIPALELEGFGTLLRRWNEMTVDPVEKFEEEAKKLAIEAVEMFNREIPRLQGIIDEKAAKIAEEKEKTRVVLEHCEKARNVPWWAFWKY